MTRSPSPTNVVLELADRRFGSRSRVLFFNFFAMQRQIYYDIATYSEKKIEKMDV